MPPVLAKSILFLEKKPPELVLPAKRHDCKAGSTRLLRGGVERAARPTGLFLLRTPDLLLWLFGFPSARFSIKTFQVTGVTFVARMMGETELASEIVSAVEHAGCLVVKTRGVLA